MSKRPMVLLSIVERDKGKKLIRELESINVKANKAEYSQIIKEIEEILGYNIEHWQ